MSAKRVSCHGFSLVEMLVTLTILSILAAVTIPFAQKGIQRSKEVKLQASLREIRNALDYFWEDCTAGIILAAQDGVSNDCYPQDLAVLVDGVERGDEAGGIKYYLRRIPKNPFDNESDAHAHWDVRGYRDSADGVWAGDDVYDVRVKLDGESLQGEAYSEW